MSLVVVKQWNEFMQVLKKKQPFKFDKNCQFDHLEIPTIKPSELLCSALKRSSCPIKGLIFISGKLDKKKLKGFIECIGINKSIKQVIVRTDAISPQVAQIIRAMKHIHKITLAQIYTIEYLREFFQSLADVRCIRKLELNSCLFPGEIISEYLSEAKYIPSLKLVSDTQELISGVLGWHTKTGRLKDLILSGTEDDLISLSDGNWRALLKLSNINISIRRCKMWRSTWREIEPLVIKNNTITTLEFINLDMDMKLKDYAQLIAHNKYLQKFSKRGHARSYWHFDGLDEFAQALKNNTTLTYLDIRGLMYTNAALAEVLSANKTLRELRMDLDVSYRSNESNYEAFYRFIEALKENESLTSLRFDFINTQKYRTADERENDPKNIDPVKEIESILKYNTSLQYVSRLNDNEHLKRNRKAYRDVVESSKWFVHLLKRTPDLFNELPNEIWLKIISYLRIRGGPDLEKQLFA